MVRLRKNPANLFRMMGITAVLVLTPPAFSQQNDDGRSLASLLNTPFANSNGGEEFNGQNFTALPRQGSMMFQEEDLNRLYEMMASYLAEKEEQERRLAGGSGSSILTDLTGSVGIDGKSLSDIKGGLGQSVLTDLIGKGLLGNATGKDIAGGTGRETLTDLRGSSLLGTLINRKLAGLIGTQTLVDLIGDRELAALVAEETLLSLRENKTLAERLGEDLLRKIELEATKSIESSINRVATQIPTSAPSFFLKSVLYLNPDNWTIWLNNRKIKAGETLEDIKVSRVQEDEVEIIWRTLNLDIISPNWNKNFTPIEGAIVESDITKTEKEEEKQAYKERVQKIQLFKTEKKQEYIQQNRNNFFQQKEARTPNATELERKQWEVEWDTVESQKWEKNWEKQVAEFMEFERRKEEERKAQIEAEKMQQKLKAFVSEDIRWNYRSKDEKTLIDSFSGAVKFRLSVNQSFRTHTMDYTEGSAKDVSLNTGKDNKKGKKNAVSGIPDALMELQPPTSAAQPPTAPSPTTLNEKTSDAVQQLLDVKPALLDMQNLADAP